MLKKITAIITILLVFLYFSGCKKEYSVYDAIDKSVWSQVKEVQFSSGSGGKNSTSNKDIINNLPDILKSIRLKDTKKPDPMTGFSAITIVTESNETIPIVFEGIYINVNNRYYKYYEEDKKLLQNFIESIKNGKQ